MFKLLLLFLRLFNKKLPTSIIKNGDLPVCKECRFYRSSLYNFYDPALARCHKFGRKDIITGYITYDYADLCREDQEKCGKEGKAYLEKERWF